MKSLKQLYKIGVGPSSSHTMGPVNAVNKFLESYGDCENYVVTLFGSLAQTGKGHGTDTAIEKAFFPKKAEIIFDKKSKYIHPNTMEFKGFHSGKCIGKMQIYSIGGGEILVAGETYIEGKEVYPHRNFEEIKSFCKANDLRLWQYALKYEDEDITQYMLEIWSTMQRCIEQGLNEEGVLAGGLNVVRRAKKLYSSPVARNPQNNSDRIVAAYAFAVGEQNASGGTVVTAPTCGASGVLPSVFRYAKEQRGFSDGDIVKGLLTAGIIGNVVKHNASISGAECGCQAEIGVACSMAAAGLAELYGMSFDEAEYAAEVALEHHLGLTCDPVCGLVQIPCIERNAVAAMRAINAVSLASFLTDSRKISFDTVVNAMYETGKDIADKYKETSAGGLAKLYGKL